MIQDEDDVEESRPHAASSGSARTSAEIVARARRDAREVLARGTFTGEPMPTGGECGDTHGGSWIGWELRLWDDGRWNIVPPRQPSHPNLLMHVVLTLRNTASVEALADALVQSASRVVVGYLTGKCDLGELIGSGGSCIVINHGKPGRCAYCNALVEQGADHEHGSPPLFVGSVRIAGGGKDIELQANESLVVRFTRDDYAEVAIEPARMDHGRWAEPPARSADEPQRVPS